MNITQHRTVVKKSIRHNPSDAFIEGLVKPTELIGFTFDRQPSNGIMVFAVHITYKITYNHEAYYLFEAYDGTIFDSHLEKPIAEKIIHEVRNAIRRIDVLFIEELSKNKVRLDINKRTPFPDNDLLRLLRSDIEDAYGR